MTQENLIDQLMAQNDEFRHLRSEHQRYERELETLRGTAPLSTDQQWRMSELKKLSSWRRTGWRTSSGTRAQASPPDAPTRKDAAAERRQRRRVPRPHPPLLAR